MKILFFHRAALLCLLLSLHLHVRGQNTVTIDPSVQFYIGGVSQLDRTKFFNIHDTWGNGEVTNTEYEDLTNRLGVNFGRGFWGPFSFAKSKANGEVGVYSTNPSEISGWGNNNINSTKNSSTWYRHSSRHVVTEHPKNVVRWNIDMNTAAKWSADYFEAFYEPAFLPEYFEPMNEPFVHAGDAEFSAEQPDNQLMRERMADWFGAIGAEFNARGINTKVVGYSSAWPSMELWDFGHWNTRMKMFMDRAGANMDAFAIHLYDGINVTGQDTRRSGSNANAILDLVETYSRIKWGTVKPFAITEFGGIEAGYGAEYSAVKSIQSVKSMNHIIIDLIKREHKIDLAIPFNCGKSTWHINAGNNYQPYGAALWRPKNSGQPIDGNTEWVYTERVKFYELWSEVKGHRVEINSANPDIQSLAFLNGSELYVVLSNLDDATQTVSLSLLSQAQNIQSVHQKALKIYANQDPIFTSATLKDAPSDISLIAGETTVLKYQFSQNVSFQNALRSVRYYNNQHLIPIAGTTSFEFNNVNLGTAGAGKAFLRMGISRKHDKSKLPVIKVNGTSIPVPQNWAGYDQANREDFFGVIDIPVSFDLLNTNNTVTIQYPDNGGFISSLILDVQRYDSKPAFTDLFTFHNFGSLPVQNSYDFYFNYSAAGARDLVVEFWKDNQWQASGTKTVSTGAGTTFIRINLPSTPTEGNTYTLKGSIRPVGTDWTQNIKTDQINNFTISDALLTDGLYEIRSLANGENIAATAENNWVPINSSPANVNQQKWQLRHLGDDVYTLQLLDQSAGVKYLEVPYAKCENGTLLGTYSQASGAHQQWKIEKEGGAFFLKPNHCWGQALDVRPSDQYLQTWNFYASNGNQKWNFIPTTANNNRQLVENTGPQILVFPNPNRGAMTLEIPSAMDQQINIRMVDLSGKTVWEQNQFLPLDATNYTFRPT
ncbi:RICIN domain-containing protein [Persicobacter sp. CCB-QB2]|uniref:RICIN domain-containing protein n=1 Tax=Persicobacter sp. CCB-QB2 TaxID=1561025 RepID=UPI000AEF996F|nr:RICIN domain-containing protein [Persicobacter sp. CCB-QB2]